jgi:hypothetical protein
MMEQTNYSETVWQKAHIDLPMEYLVIFLERLRKTMETLRTDIVVTEIRIVNYTVS